MRKSRGRFDRSFPRCGVTAIGVAPEICLESPIDGGSVIDLPVPEF